MAVQAFVDEWGVVDLGRRGRRSRRAHHAHERFLAQYAQQLRAEAATKGHRTETAMYFGLGEYAGAAVEPRITDAAWRRERRLEAEHGREQPPVHGTAGVYASCQLDSGRRCAECRAYQSRRVAENRAARRARQLCTGTRSSYDAGCRCALCVAANSLGCARWRAGSQRRDQEEVVAA